MAVTVNTTIHNVEPQHIRFEEAGGSRWVTLDSAAFFLNKEDGVEVAIALIAAAEAALRSFGVNRGTVRDHLDGVGSKLTVRPIRTLIDPEVKA